VAYEQLLATVGGDTYDLTDRQRYLWIADDGLGLSPFHRLTERSPDQHGDSDEGFRLDPRTIKLVIGLFGEDDADYWDAREELIGDIFNPAAGQLTLTFVLPNGATRALDVLVLGEGSLPSTDRQRIMHKVGIMLKAKDPTFYDPTGKSVTFGIGGASSGWAIPMSVPLGVGSTNINQVKTITNAGSWFSLPDLIRIQGPITNPQVWNLSTNEVLNFTGVVLTAGQRLDINCQWGEKTVVDQNGVNRYSWLVQPSHLSTWHLAGRREVAGGLNDIRVLGEGITSASEVYIQYRARYLNI
jgi:tail protein